MVVVAEHVDEATGEIVERPIEVVAVDIARLDEDELLAMFPTPVQAAGALLKAREAVMRAPAALRAAKDALRRAERDHKLAVGLATRDLAERFPDMAVTERAKLAVTDSRVIDAQDRLDTAWLALEYARDWDRALGRDVELLRSVNANFRQEHR